MSGQGRREPADAIDWAAAEEVLHRISLGQVACFFDRHPAERVYGLGYFADAFAGGVYLVANTEEFHARNLAGDPAGAGSTEREEARWDIGNWQFPGGLFPSASPEQQEFDRAWADIAGRQMEGGQEGDLQEHLEALCVRVLGRLVRDGAAAGMRELEGLVVAGPHDSGQDVLEKKKVIDPLLKGP